MTKKAIEKEKAAANNNQNQQLQNQTVQSSTVQTSSYIPNSKPTMAGFLNNN